MRRIAEKPGGVQPPSEPNWLLCGCIGMLIGLFMAVFMVYVFWTWGLW